MDTRMVRGVALSLGTLAVFAAAVLILLQLIPGPRKHSDYLVIGTLATLVSLAILFVVLLTTYAKDPTVFNKGKKR